MPEVARITPSVTGQVRVDFGSWAAQLVAHKADIIKTILGEGVNLALEAIPYGDVIAKYVLPKQIVPQYVDLALTTFEGLAKSADFSVPDDGGIVAGIAKMAENFILTQEQSWVGDHSTLVMPLVQAHLDTPEVAARVAAIGK